MANKGDNDLENVINELKRVRAKAVSVLKSKLTKDNYEELIEEYFPKIYCREVQINEPWLDDTNENSVFFSIINDDNCTAKSESDIEENMLDLIKVIHPNLGRNFHFVLFEY